MTPTEREHISTAGERGMAAAGFTWHPWPSPNLALRDRRYYLIRDYLVDEYECEFRATGDEGGPVFVHGDGLIVSVEAVFCKVEEESND